MVQPTCRQPVLAAFAVLFLAIFVLAPPALATRLMDFVPQEMGAYDTYYLSYTEADCRGCHGLSTTERHHSSPSFLSGSCPLCHDSSGPPDYQTVPYHNCLLSQCHDPSWGSPHHTTARAWYMECATCHNPQLVGPFGQVRDPIQEPPQVPVPSPESCGNCHWPQPLTELLPSTDQHYGSEGTLLANHMFDLPGFSLQPLEQPVQPGDDGWLYPWAIMSSQGTHHVGGLDHDCTNCHAYADGYPGPDPTDPLLIRHCERCHTPESLHAVMAHLDDYEGVLGPGGASNAAAWEAAELTSSPDATLYRLFSREERCAGCHGSVPEASPPTAPQPPYLHSLNQSGHSPGSILTLTGSAFGSLFEPGCLVQASSEATGGVWVNLPPVGWSDNQITVLIPMWSLPAGNHYLRVVTPAGASNERVFSLGSSCCMTDVATDMDPARFNGDGHTRGPLYSLVTLISPLLPANSFEPLSTAADTAEVTRFTQIVLERVSDGRQFIVADAKLRPTTIPNPLATVSGTSPAVTWSSSTLTFRLTRFWEDANGNYSCEGDTGQEENVAVAGLTPGDYTLRVRSIYWKDWDWDGYFDQPSPQEPNDPANEALLVTLSDPASLSLTADPYIKGVNPKPPKAAAVVSLLGINFGAEQADSTVNIYKPDGTTIITLAADSPRIRQWSDAKVRFKMPGKPGQTRLISLTVGGQESNKLKVKLQ